LQSENVPDGTLSFSATGFTLRIPEDFTSPKTADIPTPVSGKIVYVGVSPETKYGFSSTLLVLEDELKAPVTSRKYSDLNNLQTSKNYLEYTALSDEAILFSDSDESRVYVFEAKYNASTPRLKFVQTAKVCGTQVYLMHAALPSEKDIKNYVDLFRSFTCK
jgi:hypothetical protein